MSEKTNPIYDTIIEVGYDKASKELVKRGLVASMAQARREVKYVKIARGDKKVKQFREEKL